MTKVHSNRRENVVREIGSALAVMSFDCPDAVKDAMCEAVERGELGYVTAEQSGRLGASVARWMVDEYGWDVPAHAIRPVVDLVAGFRAVLSHFLEPGAPIVVPTPGYMPFVSLPPLLGHPVIEVPMLRVADAWAYDFDGLRRAFERGGRLLVLCNPHNPIGKVASGDEVDEIEHLVEHAGALVFSDEIHAPLRFRGRQHLVYAARSRRTAMHTITATSASKAFNIPASKCGQLIFTNPDHQARWNAVARWNEYHASSLGVVAAEAAYASGREWLADVIARLEPAIEEAVAILDRAGHGARLVGPEATYLLWLDLRESAFSRFRDGTLADTLRRQSGLIVTDGAECGAAGDGFVRFNAALPPEQLREAMHRLVDVMRVT